MAIHQQHLAPDTQGSPGTARTMRNAGGYLCSARTDAELTSPKPREDQGEQT